MKMRVFAVLVFVFALTWSKNAMADITISGTVGDIYLTGGIIRFKLTDQNQTKTCTNYPGYAYIFPQNDPLYKEWFALLLVSKKGAAAIVSIDNNTDCHVTGIELP